LDFSSVITSATARFFGPLAPMLRVVDGNFWLLLLLLLPLPLQPTFGTSRQFLIVVSILSIRRFESGAVSSSATVRASSVRSRQVLDR
jgi:hypothetical protein